MTDKTKKQHPDGRFTRTLTSETAGWRSLQVRISEWYPSPDIVEGESTVDPSFSLLLLGEDFHVDHFSDGRWRGQRYTKGTGELSPGGHRRRLRLNFKDHRALVTLGLVLPQDTVDRVAQEVSTASTPVHSSLIDIPFLDDRSISEFSLSILSALRSGAPDFYAQSAAQWLAAHLLLGPFKALQWHQSLTHERISDRRLTRVLEYIDAHLSDRLDLRLLAKEAGLSPFHFAAIFRQAVGATPHRHVHHLRMKTAKSMLRETEKSTLEIALACGFGSASHFASSFRQQFSQSPTDYRSSHRSG